MYMTQRRGKIAADMEKSGGGRFLGFAEAASIRRLEKETKKKMIQRMGIGERKEKKKESPATYLSYRERPTQVGQWNRHQRSEKILSCVFRSRWGREERRGKGGKERKGRTKSSIAKKKKKQKKKQPKEKTKQTQTPTKKKKSKKKKKKKPIIARISPRGFRRGITRSAMAKGGQKGGACSIRGGGEKLLPRGNR